MAENRKPTSNTDPVDCETDGFSLTNEKSFDPYNHGLKDGYKFWGAVVHMVRVSFGSGILVLPYSIKATGYVTGPVLILLVSLVYYHIAHILVRLEYRLCKRLTINQMTYIGVTQKTFELAPHPVKKVAPFLGKLLILYFGLVPFNSTYLQVFARSVQHLCPYVVVWKPTEFQIITAMMVPLVLVCMLRKMLQKLVPFSAATNFFSLAMAVVLLTSCILNRQPNVPVHALGKLSSVPQTIPLYVQSFVCTCSILTVKNHMKSPRRFGSSFGALNVSAVSLTFLYGSFALIAYFCLGDGVKEDILSSLPANSPLSFVIHSLYALAMLVIYLLWFCVLFDNVWTEVTPLFAVGSRWRWVAELGLRVAMNAWYYVFAVGVPNFKLVLAFCGTLALVPDVALVPVVDLIFELGSEKKRCGVIAKDILIIAGSITLFYLSIVDCAAQIGRLYSEEPAPLT